MKPSSLFRLNALVLLAAGIAFALYGPLMMALFAVPELLSIDSATYWQITSFARMFGAALFGFGLLLWSLRNSIDTFTPAVQRQIIAALVLANLMSAFVSITQQSAVWGTAAGWICTAVFGLFTLAYIFLIFKLPSKALEELKEKES